MDLSQLTFKLIILLIPGIISTFIVKNLTTVKDWTPFKFSLYSLILGFQIYLVLQLLYIIFGKGTLKVWQNSTAEGLEIPYLEILFGSLLSLLIGLFVSWLMSERKLYRFIVKLGISRKYGGDNLFYEFLRNDDVSLVFLHRTEVNLTYSGIVKFYSESESLREIVLHDVEVFDYESSKFLYKLNYFYFTWPIDKEMVIESPSKNEKNAIQQGN